MDKIELVKRKIHSDEWSQIISECRNSGMSVISWCSENGINIKTYYYHLRKLREQLCEQVTIPIGTIKSSSRAVVLKSDGIIAEISDGVSPETITAVINALKC